MAELMLVNPRKKRRRKMTAKQAKYFAPRKNPRRRRKARRRAAASASVKVYRRNPRRRRRLRRNPRAVGRRGFRIPGLPSNFIQGTLIPSAIGGAGALAVDVALGLPFIPAQIKSGPLAPLVKVAAAVGVGSLASMVAGKQMGERVTAGYLTVMAYNMAKGLLQQAMPNVQLGEYVGWVQAGPFIPDASVSAYLPAPNGADVTASQDMGSYINGGDWGPSAYDTDQVF